jgi:hypothetical protein
MAKSAVKLQYPADSWADYFPGAISPSMSLEMYLSDLRQLLSAHGDAEGERSGTGEMNTLAELALIGLMAWLESFFRDQWASTINICPRLLEVFAERQRPTSIDALALVDLEVHPFRQIGLILAERLDFGTPRQVNSLYKDLLGITPVGKREARKLESIIHDRNLLVHHGGIVRFQHSKPAFFAARPLRRRFLDSIVLDAPAALSVCDSVERTAKKTTSASARAVRNFAQTNGITLSKAANKAVQFLDCWMSRSERRKGVSRC